MSTDIVTRNLSDATLTVKDGTGSPKTLLVAFDDGSLKFDRKRTIKEIYNRASIAQVREGKASMHDVSFKAGFNYISGDASASGVSLYEALHGTGLAATNSWKGTDTANGSDYCINMTFEVAAPPGGGGGKAETITFGKFFVEAFSVSEGEGADMVDVKGKCITITSVRH